MNKMKKTLSLVFLLGLVLTLLTGCASTGFDGSWDCIEAEMPTYGLLSGADINLINRSGIVSTMCVIEIKGSEIKYNESGTEYSVSDVKRGDNEITFKAYHKSTGTDTVSLKLSSDGKNLIAKRFQSTFKLERSDIWNRVVVSFFTNIPVWVFILIGVLAVLFILFMVMSKRKESKLRSEGKLVYRDKEFYKNAEVFTLKLVTPAQVAGDIKVIAARMKLNVSGNTAGTVTFKGNPAIPWSADLTRLQSNEEQTVYRFEFTSWKSSSRSGKPDGEMDMNMLETAIEKMFAGFDPDTQVHTEPRMFHATED